MLTYGPAMRTVRALMDTTVPVLLANIQPERSITAAWDMADLTYNQGIHGAQDQANALVRIGMPFSVITGDWRSEEFASAFADWARAAQAVTSLRRTRIALLGYPMNGMGDILYDPPSMLRKLGPMIVSEDLGRFGRAAVGRIGRRRRRGAGAPRGDVRARPTTSRASSTRTPRGSRSRSASMLADGRLRRLLVPLRLDRRRRPLRAAAAAGRVGPDGRRLRVRRRGRHEHRPR